MEGAALGAAWGAALGIAVGTGTAVGIAEGTAVGTAVHSNSLPGITPAVPAVSAVPVAVLAGSKYFRYLQ